MHLRTNFSKALLGIGVAVLVSPLAFAANSTWNNTGTDFNASGSWTGGVPGGLAADGAIFNSSAVTQPQLTANLTTGFLSFNGSATGYTLSNTNSANLTLLSAVTGAGNRSVSSSVNATISAPLIFGAAAASTQEIDVTGATSNLVLSGPVSTTNSITLQKTGTGALTLSGSNSFGGNFFHNAGTLNLNHANALGTSALRITNGVTINNTSGSAVTLAGANPISFATSGAGFTFTGSNNLNLGTGAVTLSGLNAFTVSNGTLQIDGNIGGVGNLTKLGNGTLFLTGNNSFSQSSALYLDGGTLSVSSVTQTGDSAVGGQTNQIFLRGGTFDYNSSVDTVNLTRNLFSLSGAVNTITSSGSGAFNFSGPGGFITVAGGGNRNLTLGGSSTANNTFNAILSNPAGFASSITKVGTGRWVLSGNNNYTGLTDVQDGTLILNRNGGAIADTAAVQVSGGTLQLNFNETVGAVTLVSGNISGSGNLTGTSYDVRSGTASAVLAGSGVALTKSTGGTVNLTGANTYSGGTTINAGTLLVNNTTGSGTGSGAVSVNAGTLGGNGSVSGAVTVGDAAGGSDSYISPGNSIGTFTTTNTISLASDATYVFELNSTALTADLLVANGVTIDSNAVFSFADLGSTVFGSQQTFTLINNTSGGAISGTFSNLADGSSFVFGGNTYTADYQGGTGNDLVLTAVPEPTTWLLLALGLTTVLCLRRRRHVA